MTLNSTPARVRRLRRQGVAPTSRTAQPPDLTKASEPEIKVWCPQGFEGLELWRLGGAPIDLPEHVREAYHIAVTTPSSGPAEVFYQGEPFELGPGQVSLCGPGSVFSVRSVSPHGLSAVVFKIQPARVKALLNLAADPPELRGPSLPEAANRRVKARLLSAFAAFERADNFSERDAKLSALVRAVFGSCAVERSSRRPSREHRAVEVIKARLRNHPEHPHRLADLAQLTGLSSCYLLEIFKRDVGVTIGTYLAYQRVAGAKRLLLEGLSISEVALCVGFTDQSHLTRIFKRFTQTTPGRFQRDSLVSSSLMS